MKTKVSAAKLTVILGFEPVPVKIKMLKSDIPAFLRKLDAIQKRTAKSSLQLP